MRHLILTWSIRSLAKVPNKESIVLAGSPEPNQTDNRTLPVESVHGNIFFTLLAGHETTGNTMAFALIMLAVYPEYQKYIQEELDHLLCVRRWEEWTLEQEYHALQQGWLNAVLKEVLRLYCVVQFIPRTIIAPLDVIDSRGETHTIPEKTLCLLNFSAAFQNPRIWDRRDVSAERRSDLHESPALDFNSHLWLKDDNPALAKDEDDAVPHHFPFGQGPRSCPGSAFAHVEMTAALSTILKDYSLELVVDEQTKRKHGGNDRLACEETRDRAFRTLVDDIETNVSVQLLKELPIRIVERSQ